MSKPDCLSVNCDLATAEFKSAEQELRRNGELTKFLDASDALTKQWVLKARCYQRARAYFTAMMYYGMTIWHISFKNEQPRATKEAMEDLKNQMQLCRNLLEAQWKEQQTEQAGGDEPVTQWAVTPPEDLKDKITGLPQSFETLSGAEISKQTIQRKFILPNLFPDLFYSENNNVLLYGPPGTGKTMLAQACVGEIEKLGGNLKVHFYALTASSARSKWEGGTEKNLQALFQQANDLAQKTIKEGMPSKSILFIDEVESLAGDRSGPSGGDRALTTLLQLMDGFKAYPNVIILAATNRPWDLDPAFLRRFSASVFIDLEDFQGRQELIENSFYSRFQKTGPRIFNLKSRLCSLMLEEDPDSNCDATWTAYKKLYSSDNTSIEKYLGNDAVKKRNNESDETWKTRLVSYLRFLKQDYVDELLDAENNAVNSFKLQLKTYMDGKVDAFLEKIKKSVGESNSCNTDCTLDEEQIKGIRDAMIMFHYLAEITGPSVDAALQSYTNRKPSELAKSSWGYSNSDLVRLVREIFSNTASRIIETDFEKTECPSNNSDNCKDTQCFGSFNSGEEDEKKSYMECRNMATDSDFIFLDYNNHDIYAVLRVDDFCNALRNPDVDTTTGNVDDYCSFVQYSITKTYKNMKEACAETAQKHFTEGKQNFFAQKKA